MEQTPNRLYRISKGMLSILICLVLILSNLILNNQKNFKIKNVVFLLFNISLVVLFSCSKDFKNELFEQQIETRTSNIDILFNDSYDTLDTYEKKMMWVNRLNSLNPKFSTSDQVLNQNLIAEINSQEYDKFEMTEEIRMIALDLANSLPSATFISVFSSFDEIDTLLLNGQTCNFCIEELENADFSYLETEIRADPNKKDKCNCSWTCGEAISKCTHSNCRPTSSGCGFLWLFKCYERDEIDPRKCP